MKQHRHLVALILMTLLGVSAAQAQFSDPFTLQPSLSCA